MNGHRLRLCAAIACLGLLLSTATTSAALRAQSDNSNQSTVVKPARKKAPRRHTRRRATASNPSLPKLESPVIIPPTDTTMKAPSLPVPASVDADPALYPPQQRSNNGGLGTGMGVGSGTGQGAGRSASGTEYGGGGRGGGPVDYNGVFSPRDVDRKARILLKPEPEYTQLARENQVSGVVVLRAVLSSSGGITKIRAISGLPYGLTEQAIAAARKIKFEPAMKDGRAVSQHIQLEYNFNL